MKKIAILLMITILLIPISCQTGKTGSEATETAPAPRTIVFYSFTSENCGHCKKMKPVIEELQKSCKEYVSRFEEAVYQTSEGRELFRKYEVSGTPTFLITDTDGEEIDRIAGEFTLEHMERFVQDACKPGK